MRLLLDNYVDRNLAKVIHGHEVSAAADLGWGDLSNGELLAKAATGFEAMITVDKNLRHQQNLSRLPIPVVQLDAIRSRLPELNELVRYLDAALANVRTHNLVRISEGGRIDVYGERTSQ